MEPPRCGNDHVDERACRQNGIAVDNVLGEIGVEMGVDIVVPDSAGQIDAPADQCVLIDIAVAVKIEGLDRTGITGCLGMEGQRRQFLPCIALTDSPRFVECRAGGRGLAERPEHRIMIRGFLDLQRRNNGSVDVFRSNQLTNVGRENRLWADLDKDFAAKADSGFGGVHELNRTLDVAPPIVGSEFLACQDLAGHRRNVGDFGLSQFNRPKVLDELIVSRADHWMMERIIYIQDAHGNGLLASHIAERRDLVVRAGHGR